MSEIRIELIDLPRLAVGAPERIARPRVAEVRRAGRLEPVLQIEAAGQFVGQRLVVDEAIGARGVDGPFVEVMASSSRPSRRAISALTSAARFSKFSGPFSAQTASCL